MSTDQQTSPNSPSNRSYVYLLTNEAMPGLVKIGKADDPYTRAAGLYTTAVPLPFEVIYAALVDRPNQTEAALHNAFSPHRVNANREYFEIDPHQAIGILELLASDELPTTDHQPPPIADDEALTKAKEKLPVLNFADLGAEAETALRFTQHPHTTAQVSTPRQVVLHNHPDGYEGPGTDGKPISLTPLTVGLRSFLLGRQLAPHQPSPYWLLPDGRTVLEAHKHLHHRPPVPD